MFDRLHISLFPEVITLHHYMQPCSKLVSVHKTVGGLWVCWRLVRVLKWCSEWRQICSWILSLQSQILMFMSSPSPPCTSVCLFFLFVFFNTFSHLARSKCCKLSPLVKICSLHFLRLSLSFFFHLPPSSCLFPAALVYRSIFSHAVLSAIFHTACSPTLPLPPLLFTSLSLSLPLVGWLIHFIVCSLQVYPRKSTPAVDRLCVGVPAAEVSQMPLNHTGNILKSHLLTLDGFLVGVDVSRLK